MNRKELLIKLVKFSLPIAALESELAQLDWDAEETLVRLLPSDLLNVLERFAREQLSCEDVFRWAELLECREDITVDDAALSHWMNILANPYANGGESEELILNVLAAMQRP